VAKYVGEVESQHSMLLAIWFPLKKKEIKQIKTDWQGDSL